MLVFFHIVFFFCFFFKLGESALLCSLLALPYKVQLNRLTPLNLSCYLDYIYNILFSPLEIDGAS